MLSLSLSRPLNVAALVAIGISAWLSISLLTALSQTDHDLHHQRPSYPVATTSSTYSRLQGLLGKTKPDACAGWDPHASEENDPPGCLRARQLRQIQKLRVSGLKLQHEQEEALEKLERCVLGLVNCPERPLIISDFWYFFTRKQSTSGEAIWLDPVVNAIEDEGFVAMGFTHFGGNWVDTPLSWNATRMLSESVYMYMPTIRVGFMCLSDPRCVRPEDYHPHANPELRHDTSLLTPGEEGKLPAWRVVIISYWGDRPSRYSGQGQNAWGQYGQSEDGESGWSSHILDSRWHAVPWAYPNNHTHLPLSIERTCLGSPTVPWEQRNATVLLLGKLSHYFYKPHAPPIEEWARVVDAMKAEGIEILTGAEEEEGHPIPAGLKRLPPMGKVEYGKMLSSVRALLGIGNPQLSPSPFNSFCRGVPVVMPYHTDDGPTPDGWALFKDKWAQHGPAMQVGEPYAYAYRTVDDMIEQLKKAVKTPIDSYIPPEMTLQSVSERVRAFLYTDWEGEYNAILRQRKKFEYPPIMWEKCRESETCKYPILGHPYKPEENKASPREH